jgi:RHS repeat-associated protein
VTSHSNGWSATPLAETFEYDAIGRITWAPGAGTYRYEDPRHPHAVTSTSDGHQRSYDAAGNLRTLTDPEGRSLKLTWTPSGKPLTIANGHGLSTMAYGPDGQRVRTTREGTTTYYPNRYLEVRDGRLTRNYWAGDQLIARRQPTGETEYYLQDHVHSTRVITDDTAQVLARFDYQPYGRRGTTTGASVAGDRLWQGHLDDPDNGLTYMNARYYDPVLGQFTRPDSIVPSPFEPQSLNRYAFTNGDGGVNSEDPTGHVSMRVEQKKDPERLKGPHSRFIGCGTFVTCVYYSSGMTVRSKYWEDVHGEFAREVTYSGGLDNQGDWNFREIKDKTSFHRPDDPANWAPWPGAKPPTSPPLLAAPDDRPATVDADWKPWPGASEPTAPPLLRARSTGGQGMIADSPRSANFGLGELAFGLGALQFDHVETTPTAHELPEGASFLMATAPLGLLKFAAANVIAYVGIAIAEVCLLVIVRVPDAVLGTSMGSNLPPWGVQAVITPGGPRLEWRWGLFGEVQRGLNTGYATEWGHLTGHH